MSNDNQNNDAPTSTPSQELTLEGAFLTLKEAVFAFKGTRADHILLEKSLDLVAKALQEYVESKAGDENPELVS
jgi:hypothetical protein